MIKFKDSTQEIFSGLIEMHAEMSRSWKVITWIILSMQMFFLVLHMITGDWVTAFNIFCLAALFGICSLYSMTTASMLKVLDEKDALIKGQGNMITLLLEALRGK